LQINTPGNPEWLFDLDTLKFDPAEYNYKIVPERAALLKESGARLMLLAVR
jgi:hypothetical protein